MSRASSKKKGGGNATRRSQGRVSHRADHSYQVFCVNFYDNGLNAVRDEYIRRVKDGLRRSVFVIDLENEILAAIQYNEMKSRLSKPRKPDMLPTEPMALTLLRIKECIEEYDYGTKKIEDELAFDIYEYWQKNNPAELKSRIVEQKPPPKKTKLETKRGGSQKTAKSKMTAEVTDDSMIEIQCFGVVAKDHNKVGKGQPLSKRVYIKDQPLQMRVAIVIIGNLNNEFYITLLKKNVPLRGIIHFLPEECAYDLMVPRPRREKYLQETIEKIHRDIYSLRKRVATKPVGIFQQQLPQMSMCLAAKYSDDIYDQLSWYIYDVETLREQYREYYVKPYREINVKMNPSASLQDSFNMAESLSIQGHYLKAQMPATQGDVGTVSLYMESLMSTFGNPRELMTEMEVLLLANPSPAVQTKVLDKIKVYANAFKSILKLHKNDRLFVEQANPLLHSIISYMDQTFMRNIYHACLEYNILRRYFSSGYLTDSLPLMPYSGALEPRYLPKFAKLHLTDDAVTQRIVELINEYEDYTLEEVFPSVRLYKFKRALNEVFEHQKEIVIPTRLCFRDFTLFEMEEFLRDLVTPEMFEKGLEDNTKELLEGMSVTTLAEHEPFTFRLKDGQKFSIDFNMFIRPNSLKARKIAELQKKSVTLSGLTTMTCSKRRYTEHELSIGKSGRTRSSRFSIPARDGSAQDLQSIGEQTDAPNYIGLGPDHPMLLGYNLDDARQTIKVKTSKYFFEEGLIRLYEEKWNFRQMNKCLELEIDKQHLHFTNIDGNMTAVAANVRLETRNGVSLRLCLPAKECAKAVLNYPNGLTIYAHDTHVEQLWTQLENDLGESRRICTPYGCVIIFYTNDDSVLIMRYNGEVYRLYSYLDGEEEEEQEGTSEFINACSTNSTYSSYKSLPTPPWRHKITRKAKRAKMTTRESGDDIDKQPSLRRRPSQGGGKKRGRQARQTQAAALFASIDNELKYLKFIMSLYNLSYLHLKLITSMGSVVHVQKNGKIFCGKPYPLTEWHDYFANESYSMRDDGVRLIWTADGLKCYHSDGTVITSTVLEGWDMGVIEDEFDKDVTQSSSHETIQLEQKTSLMSTASNTMYINAPEGTPFHLISQGSLMPAEVIEAQINVAASSKALLPPKTMDDYLVAEEAEEVIIHDMSFITYTPNSYLLQHKNYAGIYFNFTHVTDVLLKMETEIFAADELHLRIYQNSLLDVAAAADKKDSLLASAQGSMPVSVPASPTEVTEQIVEPVSSEADPDEWTRNIPQIYGKSHHSVQVVHVEEEAEETIVEITGHNIHMRMDEKEVVLRAQLRKYGCDENNIVVRDELELKMNFNQSLPTIFRNWVEELNEFISCHCPKWKIKYFLESIAKNCKKKGFELLQKVPILSKYNFCAGNYFIDIEELKSVNDKMTNHYEWYEEDMRKFPRFPLYKKGPQIVDFPMVLSTQVFVEIPAALANTDRIHQFVDPFDKIKFRKLRNRFNEAVLFHLHPRLRLLVQQEISKRSWRSKLAEQKRRKFLEQQRLSLYLAMLKHKVYPNYFQFKDQFYYHVRNIDFFEFMSSKCNEKANPDHYKEKEEEQDQHKPNETDNDKLSKRLRRKCLCPKYIKSMQKY